MRSPSDSRLAQRTTRLLADQAEWLDFLERKLGNREDAEDILQTSLVKALGKVAQVRADESVVAWFCRNLCRRSVVAALYHLTCTRWDDCLGRVAFITHISGDPWRNGGLGRWCTFRQGSAEGCIVGRTCHGFDLIGWFCFRGRRWLNGPHPHRQSTRSTL